LVACPKPGGGGSPARPNKEEIMRLLVGLVTPEEKARQDRSPHKQLDLGKRVMDIHIMHSLVMFSALVEVGPQSLAGIQLRGRSRLGRCLYQSI
jgi:hypothetical protein